MNAARIRGASRAKKRFTTHPDKTALRAPDLIGRDFTPTGSNQKWVCDFTYSA
jgi:putative transposase